MIRSHVVQEGLEVAISIWAHVRDLTAQEDAALLAALDLEGSPPAGGTIRLAGPGGGGRRLNGAWDSEADYERFRDDRLLPALREPRSRAAGDRGMAGHRNGPHSRRGLSSRSARTTPSVPS